MLRAGAATVEITPPPGLPMGGYGARQGVAEGAHDPLTARCLVLDDGLAKIAIVICDVVGPPKDFVASARELIADACAIPGDHVCIAATHTHSGPGVLYSRRLDDWMRSTAPLLRDCVAAAAADTRAATLKLGEAELTSISQNRRHPDGPIEDRLQVLSIEANEGDQIATLAAYACHATVLEHDNLLHSADFPGAARDFIEQALGGVAIYLQGCCGDVNPTWIDHGFAEVQRVGAILGAAAVQTALEMTPLHRGHFAVNLSWSERTPKASPGRLVGEAPLRAASISVSLSRRQLPTLDDITAESAALESRMSDADGEEKRRMQARLNQLNMEHLVQSYPRLQVEAEQAVEVQALRLDAGLQLLALPGEFFVATATALRAAAGERDLLISCYANEYIGYVPPASAFPEAGYEVGFARYAEDSEDRIVAAASQLLASLGEESP